LTDIATWEDDPGQPGEDREPVVVPAPDLAILGLPVKLTGTAVEAGRYQPHTKEFRYWAAAEAVARGVSFWAPLLPASTRWSVENGTDLLVKLDEGTDLNAYYDRIGLNFFHFPAANPMVFSGESPEVVCHELGHAVLDAIKPELWDATFIEAAAFHEAFGDMSATLAVLQADSYRGFIAGAVGALNHYSRLSRAAEQLGWALREIRPDTVESECLRCLANSWFYAEPATLPPMAPAWLLSSEPHSFSRVFSGAFLDALSSMALPTSSASILAATQNMGRLLADGVVAAPVVPSFYAEVAIGMLKADQAAFQGRYFKQLATAFIRHGILAVTSQGQVVRPPRAPTLGVATSGGSTEAVIAGGDLGLIRDLHITLPMTPRTVAAAPSALDFGPAEPPSTSYAGRAFTEDLFRRGRVDISDEVRSLTSDAARSVQAPSPVRPSKYTHRVADEDDHLVLRRVLFDCGPADRLAPS